MTIRQQAIQQIERMKRDRVEYARLILENRAIIREMAIERNKPHLMLSPAWRGIMVSGAERIYPEKPQKPSLANFARAVANLEVAVGKPLEAVILDDGYACCGMEDYHAEIREYHLEMLDLYRECFKYLSEKA